jgi:hypothetical protein
MSGRPEERSSTTHATQRFRSGESLVDRVNGLIAGVYEDVFRRRIQTKRTCAKCRRGFCEGWHGSLDRGYGTCVICWADQDVG